MAERREALWRAKEHGLDVERIAVVTAERTIERVFKVRPSHHPSFTVIIQELMVIWCVLCSVGASDVEGAAAGVGRRWIAGAAVGDGGAVVKIDRVDCV